MADAQAECPPIVLAFAASDPSGGAGLHADLLTLASMGCHPLSVVTALTVQDTAGVENILAIDSDWVADQARCLLEDMQIDAIKIGMLGSVENIAAIAEIVSDYPGVPMVLDPVLASGRGDELGVGCTLASAIAAMLANGLALSDAAREAQEYTWQALAKAYRPGMGQFIPDRLFWARDEKDARAEESPAEPPLADVRGSH